MQPKIKKLTKKDLMYLLNISYPTALKQYKIILASLSIKNRNFLTESDLELYLSYDL